MNGLKDKNIAAKIFCLIMAVVLWLYVMNEQNPSIEASYTIPLEVKNLSAGYTLIDAPESVRVKVRGARSTIAAISASDIGAYVDLKGVTEGRHTIKINAVVPTSLELVEVNPDKVPLRIDTAISRSLPVEIKYTSSLPPGLTLGKVTVNPEIVTVEGPRSLLDQMDRAIIQIDLSNRTVDFSGTFNVLIVNKDGREVEGAAPHPGQVTVEAQLIQDNKKTVDVKPAFSGQLPAGYVFKQIQVIPAKVELSGTKNLIDPIEYVTTEPITIGTDTKEQTREVKVWVKDGITATPTTVTVKFTVALNH
ncbi:MAG: CdaR family protein [Sporomusaceae bacterium]|nr:CdaR family protein [Sporomusaceae bacterium]